MLSANEDNPGISKHICSQAGEGSAFRRRTGFSFVLTQRCAVGLLGAWAHFHDLREALFTEVILGRRKTCVSLCARPASQRQALLVFVLEWRDRSGHYVPYTSTQQLWQPSLSLSFPSVK